MHRNFLTAFIGTFLATQFLMAFAMTEPAQAESAQALAYVNQGMANSAVDMMRQQAQQAYQGSMFEQSTMLYRQISFSGAAAASDYYWLGESYSQLGQYANTAQAFEAATKLDGNNDLIKVRLAESYFATRQLSRALSVCQSGLASSRDEQARQKLTMLIKICSKAAPEMQRGKFASAAGHTER